MTFRTIAIAFIGVACTSALAQQYSVVQLTGFSDPVLASSLADDGSVSCTTTPVGGPSAAYVWRAGTITAYQGYPGRDAGANASNSGYIVGGAETPELHYHAALWTSAGFNDLGTLIGSSYDSSTYDVNQSGWVAGSSQALTSSGQPNASHPFVFHDGVMHDLGVVGLPNEDGTFGYAHSISAVGHAAGYFHNSDFSSAAFFWTQAGGIIQLPGGDGIASDLNNNDWIVGRRGEGASGGACLWHDGGFTDIGQGSYAIAINEQGVIVGRSGSFAALIWRNLIPQQLDPLVLETGWSFDYALDINNAGQILVHATQMPSGAIGPFVLLNPVAEPPTLVCITVLLLIIVARLRAR